MGTTPSWRQSGQGAEHQVLPAHQEHAPFLFIHVQSSQIVHVRFAFYRSELANIVTLLGELQHAVVAGVRHIHIADGIFLLPATHKDGHRAAHLSIKAAHAKIHPLPVVVFGDGAVGEQEVHVGIDRHVDRARNRRPSSGSSTYRLPK